MSEFYDELEHAGHKLCRDEDGDVDAFAMSFGYHNGPVCETCHEDWCEHCPAAPIEPCDGGAWHAAYVLKRDLADWQRLVEAYGSLGPQVQS